MDSGDQGKRFATADCVRTAIENLTEEDFGRLRRSASALLYGTEFSAADALINEAVRRAIEGATTGHGRCWPTRVPFMAFLIMTMSSIANASVESPIQSLTDYLDELAPEGLTPNDFTVEPLRAPGIDAVCIQAEEQAALEAKGTAVLSAVESHFADDEEVLMIVLRLREGQRPRQIQEEEGMTLTQYNTARRRLRRGLAKLGLTGTTT